jgi:hypothetical protein
MARKRGRRFRKASDAQDQFECIERIQRRIRQGKGIKKVIDSIEKSRQREKNAYKSIRKPSDLEERFD